MSNSEKVDTCSKCCSQLYVPIKNKAWATCIKCGYKFKFVNGSKINEIPPKSIIELIKENNSALIVITSLSIILSIIFLFFGIKFDDLLLYVLALTFFSCTYSFGKELWLFNYSFRNPQNFLINWEYPNGDKLIIGCWGLLKVNTALPKLEVSAKFEGFKWDMDNAQELVQNLIKQDGNPLLALVPSIEFTTTSNRVQDYLFFDTSDKVKIIFIYKDQGYLMINLEKKNKRYRLTYPLPSSKESLEVEARIFEERFMNRRTIIEGLYLEREQVDQILKEINLS